MPTEDAYSSGHLVLSHFGTCMCSDVETNLSWTCLVSGLLNFEHPSVLLFSFKLPDWCSHWLLIFPIVLYEAKCCRQRWFISFRAYTCPFIIQKMILLRCIHHFKSDLIINMDNMRIPGTEHSSVILCQTKYIVVRKRWKVTSKSAKKKQSKA